MLYLRRIVAIYSVVFLFLGTISLLTVIATGCGSGRSRPLHTDYLSRIATARWPGPEVTFRIHGGPSNPLGSVVRRRVKTGIERWQGALQGYITIREAQGAEVENISIRFVKAGSLGGSFIGSQTLGRTTLTYLPGDKVISSALVELDSQLWLRLPTLETIASHEGGCHGLGVRGHSPFPTDVCFADPSTASPSSADINTLRAIYSGTSPP